MCGADRVGIFIIDRIPVKLFKIQNQVTQISNLKASLFEEVKVLGLTVLGLVITIEVTTAFVDNCLPSLYTFS